MSDQTERTQALLDERWAESGYPHALRPELHKALMARGIDYWVTQGITFWNRDDGCECLAYGYRANGVPKLAIKVVGFTDPEQAIAASLGQEDIYTREDMEGAFVSGYSLGSLPVGSDPRWDENRQTVDEHMAELGWVRKEAATLGSFNCSSSERTETCHDKNGFDPDTGFECTVCGTMVDSYMVTPADTGHEMQFHYCPNCGRRVVDDG